MTEEKDQDVEKPRQGVVSVEVTIAYEDGFSSTIKSPQMVSWEATSMAIVSPGSERAMVKKLNIGAMKQTVGILEGVLDDVKNSIPTEEEIAEERQKIAELQASKARKAGNPAITDPRQLIHPGK
jgi:type III secretory pathway lipoprotein EscJ